MEQAYIIKTKLRIQ